ncbi:MAG: transglycosylase SLT domain-containing protein [Desulfobacterales bacterium]|nr:transglycosylase SLT domain-containing protein [Desulfobacterales bacterium]
MIRLITKSTNNINLNYMSFLKWILLTSFCIWFLSFSNIYAASLEPANFPSLISSLKVDTPIEFCGEEVPIKRQEIRERLEKELLLSLWDRPQVILWLKRSSRYLPHIEQMLKKNGMPDDLKYVAIAESAFRPHAGSSKGAMGFWQFMVGTGRKYGLVINEDIDERRNIFASTAAAIQYFKELHKKFRSWTLAAAAYNMGEEGLMSEILEQDTGDYYNLYLPLETQRYIFRVLSVKLILYDPEKYGFNLTEKDYYPPLTFDQVQVKCLQETPIRVIAQAGKTHFKVIKDLNPEIRGYYITKGNHNILIPKGASKGFQARYQGYVEKFFVAQKERVYIVKKGDNLSSIAERFGIPLVTLIIWNRIDIKRPIHPGDRLIIYTNK